MTRHALDVLLKPGSIALVGASERADSPGYILADMVIHSNFSGRVYPINPNSQTIFDLPCFPDLESLPEVVDHVILAIGNPHLESALNAVVAHGAKAVTIYSSTVLEDDINPPLLKRLGKIASDAGLTICGSNGMGFYSLKHGLYAGIFPKPVNIQQGGISYIAQSGSAFTALCHNGCRLGFNLCISSGNEMTTTVSDYMDWSLEQPDTRVIGLFLEAVRDPRAFTAALQKAVSRDIPVVVLKIGKSPLSAKMALTHTGAVAGSHAAFEALYRRYGVISVDDFDEMAAVLMLMQHGAKPGPGSLATIQESGGFRELITDLAHELDIEFAEIEASTRDNIQTCLDPGLKAENPLDAWGSHKDFEKRFLACVNYMMADPNVAGGIFFSNFRDNYYLSEAICRVVEEASRKTSKPIALGNCYSDLNHDNICRRGFQQGIAVIDGPRETLLAFKHLFAYRQFKENKNRSSTFMPHNPANIEEWRKNLSSKRTLSESEAMSLLTDFSIAVPRQKTIDNESTLVDAAKAIGYPLVLKTAEAGIHHKSDAGGVVIDIQTETELLEHYRDISKRLGPSALLTEMIDKGTEVGLGIVNDAQFGPLLMIAAGGILIELLSDRAVALCPVTGTEADELLSGLKIDALIHGVRGQAAGDRRALIDIVVKLSRLAFELKDVIVEIDINPVIVNTDGATAVDALVVT